MNASSPRPRAAMSCFPRLHVLLPLVLTAVLLPFAAAAKPIHHCVLFKFKDGTSHSDISRIFAELDQLPAKIPGIKSFQWGINNSPEGLNQGLTHAFIMTFESAEARDLYTPHAAHKEFAEKFTKVLDDLFVFDLEVPEAPPPAEPGRVHHMVFFKFKPDAPKEKIDEVNAAFAELPKKISGLMLYEAGTESRGRAVSKGFTNGYLLTFVNNRARNDYVNHPAHKAFGKLLGPVLGGVLVLDFTVVPSSRSLFVVEGLEPYAVYQRDANGVADMKFRGISRDDGPIEARLRAGRRTVPGFDWKKVGEAAAGTFEAVMKGVPAGGEYTVEVRRRDSLGNVADHTEVANILVGDIWILAGQSNMEGVGNLIDVEEPSPDVHCYTMAQRWELAREPLHWLDESPDPVHSSGMLKGLDEQGRRARRAQWRKERRKGAGLGLPFAKELVRRTGVPIGLIAAAHGGTSMQQWDPARRDEGGASLYGSMYKQVRYAGGKVKGVVWYQGESDANPQAARLFAQRFQDLVAAFRKDFNDPGLPFYYVQIGRFVIAGDPASWDRIQELQRLAEGQIPSTAFVSVVDLPLDDLIHVSTGGQKRVGARLARIAHKELFGAKDIARGPRLEGVEVSEDKRTIRVKYREVNGGLLPGDKVEGFSLKGQDGKEIKLIFNASVDRQSPDTVVLKLQAPVPAGAAISYGAGFDPVCNLVDAEDMAAPAFGPLKLQESSQE